MIIQRNDTLKTYTQQNTTELHYSYYINQRRQVYPYGMPDYGDNITSTFSPQDGPSKSTNVFLTHCNAIL